MKKLSLPSLTLLCAVSASAAGPRTAQPPRPEAPVATLPSSAVAPAAQTAAPSDESAALPWNVEVRAASDWRRNTHYRTREEFMKAQEAAKAHFLESAALAHNRAAIDRMIRLFVGFDSSFDPKDITLTVMPDLRGSSVRNATQYAMSVSDAKRAKDDQHLGWHSFSIPHHGEKAIWEHASYGAELGKMLRRQLDAFEKDPRNARFMESYARLRERLRKNLPPLDPSVNDK